jgi:hypothetical protein
MSQPFNPSVVRRAIEVVDRSGADRTLLELLTPRGPGRRPEYNTRAFLVGSILSVQWQGQFVIRTIHRTLTQRLPMDIQVELGIRAPLELGGEILVTQKHWYAITEAIGRHLEFGNASAPELSETERDRRRTALLAMLHDLIVVTLPPAVSTTRAIDGSGLWSHGRRPHSAREELLARDANGEDLGDAADISPRVARQVADPDARYGVKTRKDGERETYYGYELHASVRAPDFPGQRGFIPVIETFEVTPAGTDVVAPTLNLLDRARDLGFKVTEVLVDRHYSYKTAERWARQLIARDIRQVLDLHPHDQGFSDYDGMRFAAGWPHCPATPDHLGTIIRPAPHAAAEAQETFARAIQERGHYALHRITRVSLTSGARYSCPALDGRIGCPLREGTVEVAHEQGLPVVSDPPDPATAPKCCTQRTVTTGLDAHPKLEQSLYWGGEKWRHRNALRTYVEGIFGNIKNPSTEDVRRGFFRLTGLAKVNFAVAMAVVAFNLRIVRGNAQLFTAGDGDLLLQEDEPCEGFLYLSSHEAAAVLAMRAGTQGPTAPEAATG